MKFVWFNTYWSNGIATYPQNNCLFITDQWSSLWNALFSKFCKFDCWNISDFLFTTQHFTDFLKGDLGLTTYCISVHKGVQSTHHSINEKPVLLNSVQRYSAEMLNTYLETSVIHVYLIKSIELCHNVETKQSDL